MWFQNNFYMSQGKFKIIYIYLKLEPFLKI